MAEYHRINKHNDDVDELFDFTYHQRKERRSDNQRELPGMSGSGETSDDSDSFPDSDSLDREFMIYKNNIDADPDHILRYCFNESTTPLYYTSSGKFDEKGRKMCENCGAARIFEFQVNSTLLSVVESLSDLEWGVVAVYSCPNSCAGSEYQEEVVCAQFDSDLAEFCTEKGKFTLLPRSASADQKPTHPPSVVDEINEDDWS